MVFDPNDPLHMEFIRYTALMRANMFGLQDTKGVLTNDAKMAAALSHLRVSEFKPDVSAVIFSSDEEAKKHKPEVRDADAECDEVWKYVAVICVVIIL